MAVSEVKIRVRYNETGKMGFVHHSNYFNWFDLAQEKLIDDAGYDYTKVEAKGLKFIPISQNINYYAPAYYRDELTIRISVKEIKGIKMSFAYEILRQSDEKIIAKGESAHILMDSDLRPAIIKRELPELFERL